MHWIKCWHVSILRVFPVTSDVGSNSRNGERSQNLRGRKRFFEVFVVVMAAVLISVRVVVVAVVVVVVVLVEVAVCVVELPFWFDRVSKFWFLPR
jgi:hypothetical protein